MLLIFNSSLSHGPFGNGSTSALGFEDNSYPTRTRAVSLGRDIGFGGVSASGNVPFCLSLYYCVFVPKSYTLILSWLFRFSRKSLPIRVSLIMDTYWNRLHEWNWTFTNHQSHSHLCTSYFNFYSIVYMLHGVFRGIRFLMYLRRVKCFILFF